MLVIYIGIAVITTIIMLAIVLFSAIHSAQNKKYDDADVSPDTICDHCDYKKQNDNHP